MRLSSPSSNRATIHGIRGLHPLAETKPTANFDYSGPMTEAVLLGCLASVFPQQELKWDAAGLNFKNPGRQHVHRPHLSQGLGNPGTEKLRGGEASKAKG